MAVSPVISTKEFPPTYRILNVASAGFKMVFSP